MNFALLRRMTNEELLVDLDDKRHQSPLIGELCRRLEEAGTPAQVAADKADCPVCLATLKVELDPNDERLTVEVAND